MNPFDKPRVIIKDWRIDSLYGDNTYQLSGHVFGHPNHIDDHFVFTSKILRIDFEKGEVETLNTLYTLEGDARGTC